jgi:hypothetical protein
VTAARLRAFLLVLALAGAAGCLDPIVGSECAQPLHACGSRCVDLSSSLEHCGACGQVCTTSCVEGRCVGSGGDAGADAEPRDGVGAGDGAVSVADVAASADSSTSPGADVGVALDLALADGALAPDVADAFAPADRAPDTAVTPDAALPDGSADAPAAADAARDVPPELAADVAAGADVGGTADAPAGDASSPDGGDAGMVDAPPPCPPGQTFCSSACTDLKKDPDNCGVCGWRCRSGICMQGICASAGAGHVVVIGHDYVSRREGMSNLIGNAVFLAAGNPARVLAYEGDTTAAAIAGTHAAISEVAGDSGRSWIRTVTSAAELAAQLATHDVLLIYAQTNADDASLSSLGQALSDPLRAFLAAGKVVVLLDGASSKNTGTYRILQDAGLFRATMRAVVPNGEVLMVASPGDAVATQVPRSYAAEESTVFFDTPNKSVVVQTAAGGPVVVHMVF